MLLPEAYLRLFKWFAIILFFGVFFANGIITILAFIPFVVAVAGFLTKPPSELSIKRYFSREKLFAGELLDVSLEIEVNSGIGIIALSDILPIHFELGSGSNYIVFWKGFGHKKVTLSYSVKCTTSGTYFLGNTSWESRHCVINHVVSSIDRNAKVIEVRPRLFETAKAKSSQNFNKIPLPCGDLCNIGISTLEFKDIKQYSYGDPFKHINWKATARNISSGSFWPIINEYEKEGKKSVWIYFNTSRTMNIGSNIKNSFEYGLEVVSALTDFYIKQNCSVAFSTYNGHESFIYPGMGEKQYHKILKVLLKMGPFMTIDSKSGSKNTHSLQQLVSSHKKYFIGSKPLFIIVTRYTEKFFEVLQDGIKELSKYTSNKRGVFQIMVINIIGYGLGTDSFSERLTADLLSINDRKSIKNLRKNCIWIDWDPSEISFSGALIKQVNGI